MMRTNKKNDKQKKKPDCSKREPSIIIQDKLLASIQTEKAAAGKKTRQTQFTDQKKSVIQSGSSNMPLTSHGHCQQALSLPVIDVDEPYEVITTGEVHTHRETNSNSQSHLSSNMKAPKPPSTAEQTLLSYEYGNQQQDRQQNLPAQENETTHLQYTTLRPSASQNIQRISGSQSIDQRTSLEGQINKPFAIQHQSHPVPNQPSEFLSRSYQKSNNQNLPVNQDYIQYEGQRPEVLRKSNESNYFDQRSNSATTRMRTIERNSPNVSNSLHQTFELPQQGQLQPNHQDSQQQLPPPPVQSKVSNSILKEAILTTIYNYVQNERQLQASLSGRSTDQNDTDYATAPRNITAEPTRDKHSSKIPTCSSHQSPTRIQRTSAHENVHQNTGPQKQMVNKSTEMTMNRVHFKDNVVRLRAAGYLDSACQTNECMLEESLSSYRKLEMISDEEMSTEEPPVETTNHVDWTGFSTESNSADRPTAAQNSTSTNHQTHPRVILEQQMLDHFATLFTQMGSTLNYTHDMYNNLRDSIHEVADTYKTLLGSVERFNTLGNSVSNAAPYSNVTPEVPQVTETVEIQTEVTTRENSGNGDQHSNNDDNKAPKKIHNNLWRFVLPPKYDPNDTRWTLKYQQNMPGLVELIPQSGIYVSYGNLKYAKQKSKDCKTLARRLLLDVFNTEALSVCLSPSEEAQASNNVGSNVRPKLDGHARNVLLSYVLKYGLKCGWNTDIQPILNDIHSTVRRIRFKFGVMVKC